MSEPLIIRGKKVLREYEWNAMASGDDTDLALAINTIQTLHDKLCLACTSMSETPCREMLAFLNQFRSR